MRTLSRILLVTLLVSLASIASAEPLPSWGVQAGVFSGHFGFGARKDFVLGGDISQISAQAAVYFPAKTTFHLDADYHFMLKAGDGRFYPLAGLDFAFNSDSAKFGANVGVGVNFLLTKSLAAFAEAKYVFSDWNGWGFIGGVYF